MKGSRKKVMCCRFNDVNLLHKCLVLNISVSESIITRKKERRKSQKEKKISNKNRKKRMDFVYATITCH